MTLREARFRADITQAELYLKTGINQATLSRIENGTLVPTDNQKKLISKALKNKNIEFDLCKK